MAEAQFVTRGPEHTPTAEIWNQFVASSPYGDVMQCLEWGEVKKPLWQPLPLCLEENGKLVASALVLKRRLPRVPRSILYLPRGPIVDWNRPELVAALFAALCQLGRRHGGIMLKMDPAVPDGTPGLEELWRAQGWRPSPDAAGTFAGTQPRSVMKLPLGPDSEDALARFHPKWRYNIKLAGRKGVRVDAAEDRDDLEIFHAIYRETAQRDGFTGRPLAYFQRLWDALIPAGLAQLFITRAGDEALSAAICFVLPPQCWYVYGASSNAGRNLMPNHLMQWTMMEWARARGCTVYDFRGIADVEGPGGGEHDGLYRFKAGFGAEVVRYAGEWDLPLSGPWYWLWGQARPRLVQALRRRS